MLRIISFSLAIAIAGCLGVPSAGGQEIGEVPSQPKKRKKSFAPTEQSQQPTIPTNTPSTLSPTPEQIAATKVRQEKCAAEWKELQGTGKVPEAMKWPEYWNGCNARHRRVTPASSPGPVAGKVEGDFKDPTEYCAAVGTIDAPDKRYVGPKATQAMATALKVNLAEHAGGIEWRCMNGAVYACVTLNAPACGPVGKPIITNAMRQFCTERPNDPVIGRAYTSSVHIFYKCQGTIPVVSRRSKTDMRGFSAEDWTRI